MRFRTLHSTPVPSARAVYRAADYALDVRAEEPAEPPARRASVDTLTLSFGGADATLAGLDAYTNAQQWRLDELTLPAEDDEAALGFAEEFDEHGIFGGGDGPVHFSHAPDAGLLRIELGQGEALRHVRCLSCAVAGLGAEGELVELWLDELELVEAD